MSSSDETIRCSACCTADNCEEGREGKCIGVRAAHVYVIQRLPQQLQRLLHCGQLHKRVTGVHLVGQGAGQHACVAHSRTQQLQRLLHCGQLHEWVKTAVRAGDLRQGITGNANALGFFSSPPCHTSSSASCACHRVLSSFHAVDILHRSSPAMVCLPQPPPLL